MVSRPLAKRLPVLTLGGEGVSRHLRLVEPDLDREEILRAARYRIADFTERAGESVDALAARVVAEIDALADFRRGVRAVLLDA